ncbi:MAG: 50S ribosomal protein L11 methyltransferase [Thermodesulfobacteriota bacterium]|nr:50S ribosomal protein L11 methyltransferase [Thermodesulfobacteriota bacterium]
MGREFTPFTIGNRFRIIPEGTEQPQDERINIIMAAGAFGSGEHETTANCLTILENHPQIQGAKVLDLGSGTGILSIAALKLGAQSAMCVDIDPGAVKTCQHNCALNHVSEQVSHVCGTLGKVEEENFDFILANIYGDILLAVANELTGKAVSNAPMLLSGILYEYNFDVRQAYKRLGFNVEKNIMLDEFSTVLLQKG